MGKRAVLSLLFIGMFVGAAGAASADVPIQLAWDAPTQNEDGTPLTDLAGYKMYMATASILDDASNAQVVATIAADLTTWHVVKEDLPDAPQIFFRVSAYDESGNESALSNEVQIDRIAPDFAKNLHTFLEVVLGLLAK